MTTEDWYRSPTAMHELAGLLEKGVLKEAMELLKANALPAALRTCDVTAIALNHAVLSGYNKALQHLEALATNPTKDQKPMPPAWDYIKANS